MPVWTCEACQRSHEVPEGAEEYRNCVTPDGDTFQAATHEGWTYVEDTDITLCPDHALPFADSEQAPAG